jgi:hypothetical protein
MYSEWLNYFTNRNNYRDKKYFSYDEKRPAYNLLCGMFATKIKFTKEYYDNSVNVVKNATTSLFEYAFDEILLIELFKNILYHRLNEDYNPSKFDKIVYSNMNNIKIITADCIIGEKFRYEFENDKLIIHLDSKVTSEMEDRNDSHLFNNSGKEDYINLSINQIVLSELFAYIDENLDYDKINNNNHTPLDIQISAYSLDKISDWFRSTSYYPSPKKYWSLNELLNLPYGGKWQYGASAPTTTKASPWTQ